jgi:hypothetical protein
MLARRNVPYNRPEAAGAASLQKPLDAHRFVVSGPMTPPETVNVCAAIVLALLTSPAASDEEDLA